jgi:hypothetical protein
MSGGILHRLAHLLGLNHGRVYGWWEGTCMDIAEGRGVSMIGHRCSTCGDISHTGPANVDRVLATIEAERRAAVRDEGRETP